MKKIIDLDILNPKNYQFFIYLLNTRGMIKIQNDILEGMKSQLWDVLKMTWTIKKTQPASKLIESLKYDNDIVMIYKIKK